MKKSVEFFFYCVYLEVCSEVFKEGCLWEIKKSIEFFLLNIC